MPKVEIELDTLRTWFLRLEMNETEEVTELIFDAVAKYEREIEEKAMKVNTVLNSLEPSLTMRQLELNKIYRIKKDANFKQQYLCLLGAEVMVVAKARTNATVRIIEPNTKFTGQQLKVAVSYLTTI